MTPPSALITKLAPRKANGMLNLWEACLTSKLGPTRNKLLRDEFCGSDPHSAQFEMFRYTAIEDLEAVYLYRHDARLNHITRDIKQGKWKTYLNTYRTIPQEAHFILMAAYRYGTEPTLSAKEVATAFYFLSMAIDDPAFDVGKPYKHYLESAQWRSLPKNEQVAIRIHKKDLNKDANELLDGTIFFQNCFEELACSQFADSYEFASASIFEKTTLAHADQKMTINFGFSSRRDYINAIFSGQNPYALLTPYSKSKDKMQYIHGAALEKGSAWASRHDTVHIINRRDLLEHHYGERFWNEFKQVILALQDLYESRPPIQCDLLEDSFAKTHLTKDADENDLATRLIDELLISYLDGEQRINWFDSRDINTMSKSVESLLTELLEDITETFPDDHHLDIAFNPLDDNSGAIKTMAKARAEYMVISALEPHLLEPAANPLNIRKK
jgi:hypothetical protein